MIPEEIVDCPFCENGKVILAPEKYKHVPTDKDYILEGYWYVYRCLGCKEAFTTTESDTISQNNLKKRKKMESGKEVFEAYQKLDLKEQIIFNRSLAKSNHDEIEAMNNRRMEVANDLENAGISTAWIMKHILRMDETM